ncbi:MAG: 7-cyano-7-deazaguanine synthase QueC [Planctomycetaceae bacterium]|nr:7-cyano-7-deazaguanine synthase QueC [Planctomycetaceae bacterium]
MSECSGRLRAVVLLSGGLDSQTTLAMAQAEGFQVCALTVRYGQRHAAELRAAERIASAMAVCEHRWMSVDIGSLGGSSLTTDQPVPVNRTPEEMVSGIPSTYVPARNTIMLSCALGCAEAIGAFDIFIGVNALDYAGYPDCRPEYIAAFEHMARLATKQSVELQRPVRIHTPVIHFTKEQIIRRGLELGVDYSLSSSCYQPDQDGNACGECDACLLRLAGFAAVGISDPIRYRSPRAETR